jgi:hypothetical protein
MNKITAEAPIDAMRFGYKVEILNSCDIHAVAKIAIKQEMTERSFPLIAKLTGSTGENSSK